MNVRLHLFSDRKSNLNILRLYEFFDDENFKYSQKEKYVNFRYVNKALDNKASFVFVKHNVIEEIFQLSAAFTNLNMFVEFPLMISDYCLNEILEIVNKLCHKFGLFYFMDINKDVMPFNKKEVFDKILDYRDEMTSIEELTKNRGRLITDHKKLYEICSYQDNVEVLNRYFNGDIEVNEYIIMRDLITDELALSVEWKVGQPAIFPRHIDYIHVYFPDLDLPSIVPAKVVTDKIHRFLALLPDFIEGTRILKPGNPARKASKHVDKWKEHVVDDEQFEVLKAVNIIDYRNQL